MVYPASLEKQLILCISETDLRGAKVMGRDGGALPLAEDGV